MDKINRCVFITSLKLAGKVYVKGETLFPPLSPEVISEIELGTNHIQIYFDELIPVIEDITSEVPVIEVSPTKKIRKKKP